ncbi:hypothetical protein [Corallococcus macrosporus]|uniref:Uncharacterized protein n=1 Tax=Myxococcus fulvus (strain ATCC BAA-855 / HW-1) TaxID=483219 RepID=F8CA91_MYXFH|nr:hypothetical protein [Corallococcus macrosporus]AEI64548.1 hypothetical protein LILAB_13205 [Corallococcus macrosporus]
METTLASDSSGRARWGAWALTAIPAALLPVGLLSYRARRRRARRPAPLHSTLGLGLVSLAILRLAGNSRRKGRVPPFSAFLPEEFSASVASGH